MKILAFAGSSSRQSINQQLAYYCASLFQNTEVDRLDLNDFEMPLFSVDAEEKLGPQKLATDFLNRIANSDLIILSLAEHNGSYSVAFKNIFDWASRQNGKPFQNKKVLLLATSPGVRGGQSVLDSAKARFPFMGANIVGTFSLPEFNKNFSSTDGIIPAEFKNNLLKLVESIHD